MSLNLALKTNDLDNVATIFANDIKDGMEVEVRDKKGNAEIVKVIGDVPYGHKIAVKDIKTGELINKYGEEIGIATKDRIKAERSERRNKYGIYGLCTCGRQGRSA